jgi:phosphatidylserine decarboxylase
MSLRVWMQHVAPQKLLTRIVHAVMRIRLRPFKNFLIRLMTRLYGIDIAEAANADPEAYEHFNAFFTRALKAGARAVDPDPDAVLMPADGRISQLGPIERGCVFQAKGHSCTADALLGDADRARAFEDGSFVTVYLSPRDYHRVHTPFPGRLLETLHVPGRLFSVAPFTVDAVPGLFARNERLVCHFETSFGPMAVVLVGAMLVSGVETVWSGVEIPPYATKPERKDYRDASPPVELGRGAELGRFNMGSTVIVLFPRNVRLDPALVAGQPVRVGQRLGAVARGLCAARLAGEAQPPERQLPHSAEARRVTL